MITENPASKREIEKFKALASDVVRHHLGSSLRRITHKAAGLTNFVFAVRHANGDFVVRISPRPEKIDTFLKEQWAQKAARAEDVPVPEILEVGLERISHPYMISTKVEGQPAIHHPKRLEILKEMGRLARVINSIRTSGFGATFDWSENKLSRNATFAEFVREEFRLDDKLKTLEKLAVIDRSQSKRIRGPFRSVAKGRRPTLNHGDLRLKNVIVDKEGRINAIIDWEHAASNLAPAWELAFALHDLGIDGKQCLLDGYQTKPAQLNKIMPLSKAINLASYASAAQSAADAGDRKLLASFKLRLSGLLDLYSL